MTFKPSFKMALFALALVGSLFSVAAGTQAAELPPLKVVIVNIEAIRAGSTAYKEANEQFVKISTELNADLQKEDQQLRDAQADLSRRQSILSPEAYNEERKRYEQRVAAFQRKVQELQQSLGNSQAQAMGEINEEIVKIISEYMQENKVTLVLPESVTVLAAKAININAYVLENLNKRLPSVQVAKPGK